MSTLKAIAKMVHERAKSKGWWDQEYRDDVRTFGDLCSLLHSEVSEAYEDYRNNRSATEIYYEDDGKPCGIPVEFGDIVIRILDNCEKLGIDIEAAIAEKDRFNATRPHRHGGKRT